MPRTAAEPLGVVRRLYASWNAGSVAEAADLLAPDVRWESFGETRPPAGPEGLHATLAGAGTGGTLMLSPLTVDLLVGTGDHVVACARRSGGPRLEVWTVRGGRVVRYRGFPMAEGLAVLTETTGSRRLEVLCRDVAAFHRGDAQGWPASLGGERLDDIVVLTDGPDRLAVRVGGRNLVLTFSGAEVQRVAGYATPEDAVAAATTRSRAP